MTDITNGENTWIQTYTGKALDLIDPQPEQIDIYDIAHALAYIPRYTGHARGGYSVGQHSIHVAELLPEELKLHGLMHDDEEYAFGDWSSPCKVIMRTYAPMMVFFAKKMKAAIDKRFGLPALTLEQHAQIKEADLIMLATEKRDFMGPSPRPNWGASSGYSMRAPREGRLAIYAPEQVERLFLRLFQQYGGRIQCL